MIGGITKGSCFSGCVEYVLALKEENKEARLLYSEGLLTDTPEDIVDGFECQRHLNSRVQHWCGHISLSYSPEDSARLSDEAMVKLALEYMEKMGITNTQFIIAHHLDKEHPHCHTVYNRVDNDGRCVSDSYEYYRSNAICKALKKKYGLTFGENKDKVKVDRLKGRSKTDRRFISPFKPPNGQQRTGPPFSVSWLRKASPSGRNSEEGRPMSKVFLTSKTGRSSRLHRLTATADAHTRPSATLSTETRTVRLNPRHQLQDRCNSSLNRRRAPQQKSSKPEPILPKVSVMRSADSSRSDLPTTRMRRHSSVR